MTNKEKFAEVFGREANTNECPIYCHTTDGDKCPYYKNKCYSGKWWGAEYKDPRKGHWIFDGDCLICSKCKKAYMFSGSNFCPNCGADMRSEE